MSDSFNEWRNKLGTDAPIKTFSQLIDLCQSVVCEGHSKRLLLACAGDAKFIEALELGRKRGLVRPILVGDGKSIGKAAKNAGISLAHYELIDMPEYDPAVAQSVDMLAHHDVDILMRGAVPEVVFLKAVLAKKEELDLRGVLSQVCCLELPSYHKLLFVSDPAVVIKPTLHQKIGIIENAVLVANALGKELPKVALMAAVEVVNPSMGASMDNAVLAKMGERGQIKGAVIDGPLSLDVATFESAAKLKGVKGEVAGDADILIANKIEEANILYRSLIRFARAKMGSVVVGCRKPIILASRVELAGNELNSIALAVLLHAFHSQAK